MELLITIVHVTTCLVLILAVLLQSGRGGGMGAALGGGGGAGSQIFGGRGASTFLTKITSGAAVIFFLTSITLAGLGSRSETTGERLLRQKASEAETLSASDGAAADTAEAPPTDDASEAPATREEAPTDAAAPEDAPTEPGAIEDAPADATPEEAADQSAPQEDASGGEEQ
ncbi:MAG: preprotein translocase subunit SecG [Myxococcota bacterium]